ncbi:molybdenum cofactor sulfurase [Tritrichomonas foetus]|uniref:Molybdenum cofactor sulfurase n=1 Tax=Tritrichomonas foetus TaxID=1144522 RepID=A0A1J4J5P7_9EUKA|nr:molybdenum cofactor sulfurase [Tritrichomonas foetus]|eukprot:OHS92773.1 molybdenum cofactor sulfurase [Tritrichomonas foetus]
MIQATSHFQRYRWIRVTLFGLLIALVISLANTVFTCDTCQSDSFTEVLNSDNYPQFLPEYRRKYMKHLINATYLDYTGAGVYNDLDIELFRRSVLFPTKVPANQTKIVHDKVIQETRDTLLSFLGTSSKYYTVVFLASATQALKLIGENYKWNKDSKYIYTRYNHNSVLGIRKYAVAAGGSFNVVNTTTEMQADQNALFAVALEENFAGGKISKEEMIRLTHTEGMTVLADTAAYLPTNKLNLTETPFHAVVLSFYKIIGFPNFGACVIRNDFLKEKLEKKSFLAGSVDIALSNSMKYRLKSENQFEDDEVPYEMCQAALLGMKFLMNIGIDKINEHVYRLSDKLYKNLRDLKHSNDQIATEIYGNHDKSSKDLQGGIVAFNVKKSNGDYVGYSQVVKEAKKSNIHLRGGCHCNPGACFASMKIPENVAMEYFNQKTTCGDNNDIINGIPLGSVRASLGWATTDEDIELFTKFIIENYVF